MTKCKMGWGSSSVGRSAAARLIKDTTGAMRQRAGKKSMSGTSAKRNVTEQGKSLGETAQAKIAESGSATIATLPKVDISKWTWEQVKNPPSWPSDGETLAKLAARRVGLSVFHTNAQHITQAKMSDDIYWTRRVKADEFVRKHYPGNARQKGQAVRKMNHAWFRLERDSKAPPLRIFAFRGFRIGEL